VILTSWNCRTVDNTSRCKKSSAVESGSLKVGCMTLVQADVCAWLSALGSPLLQMGLVIF